VKIKEWILSKKCTIEEAYKCFDRDFDGLVSKSDLRASLISLLEIPSNQLVDAKIDRLFRLLDTFKAGVV
jgi:Ca2+-binding EF-hand superfamily protein